MELLIWLVAILIILWGLTILVKGAILLGIIVVALGCILGSGRFYSRS